MKSTTNTKLTTSRVFLQINQLLSLCAVHIKNKNKTKNMTKQIFRVIKSTLTTTTTNKKIKKLTNLQDQVFLAKKKKNK